MIRTPADIASRMQLLLGDLDNVSDRPGIPFHPQRIDFLAAVSSALMSDEAARKHPDLTAFAFWCRRANLQRLAREHHSDRTELGQGLVLHICPANVPVNVGYSLAFALLTGNASICRLSSTPSDQADILVRILRQVLSAQSHAGLKNDIHLVRYPHDDAVSTYWLEHSLGRIVWGGDETVRRLRALRSHPRSREIAFADRFSLAVLEAGSVARMDDEAIGQLAHAFYNDAYPMNQAACSSPQLVAWIGTDAAMTAAQKRFWPALRSWASNRFVPEPIQAMDKLVGICDEIICRDNVQSISDADATLARIGLDHLDADPCGQRGYGGTFHEIRLECLDDLAEHVDERFQTLTCHGFGQEQLKSFVLRHCLPGIDRIVPVGRALDMSLLWDGYDLGKALVRVVDIG